MKKLVYNTFRTCGTILILLLVLTRHGLAQIELVKDINPNVVFYNEYGSMAEVSNVLYFAADQSLWRTDGSPDGAVKIKTFEWIGPMINLNGTLVFSADDGRTGKELWKSDGTKKGTVLLKDINPGKADSDPTTFTMVNNHLFFVAATKQTGAEIWRTDGTRQGTDLLHDLRPGPESSNPTSMVNYNGKLVFVANDGRNGNELHVATVGRKHATVILDIVPGSAGSDPGNLTWAGSFLYFSANTPEFGNELWKTNGTSSGTVMVSDIWQGPQSSYPSLMINVDGTLFFIADDGINGSEFWKSNGTDTSTSLAFELFPGPEPTFGDYPYDEEYSSHNFAEATANGKLYFGYRNELYESDGTTAGTKSLGKINDGYIYYSPRLYEARGTIYVIAMDEGNCCNYGHVWHLARVENSTLVTVTPLPQAENMNLQLIDTSIGIFFPFADAERNFMLWISDGTAEGTYPIHDSQRSTMSSTPREMVVVDNYITFYADDHIEHVVTRLWRSDGTPGGTYRISEQPVSPPDPSNDDSESSSWITKITSTRRIHADPGNIHLLELYKGEMYFTVTDPVRTYVALWRSDGTRKGTIRIKVLTHEYGGGAQDGAVFNDVLYFAGTPKNIWRTDGTTRGTFQVGYSGPNSVTGADEFTSTENTLFFRADYPGIGVELFKLDAEGAPVRESSTKLAQLAAATSKESIEDGDDRLHCYPNPFANAFTFAMSTPHVQPMKLSLRTMEGKTILQMNDLTTNQTYRVGQELRTGFYLMYVQVGDRVYVQRVVKVN